MAAVQIGQYKKQKFERQLKEKKNFTTKHQIFEYTLQTIWRKDSELTSYKLYIYWSLQTNKLQDSAFHQFNVHLFQPEDIPQRNGKI